MIYCPISYRSTAKVVSHGEKNAVELIVETGITDPKRLEVLKLRMLRESSRADMLVAIMTDEAVDAEYDAILAAGNDFLKPKTSE